MSRRTARRHNIQIENLEPRLVMSAITILAGQEIRELSGDLAGVNINGWDGHLSASQGNPTDTRVDAKTQQILEKSGMNMYRISNGSGTDTGWHFDQENSLGFASGVGLLANVADSVDGNVMFAVNYGTGTPQEAAAYLAYLNGDINNNFVIGRDTNGKDWKTVSYWAGLRSQQPLGLNDGLNHLRTNHPAPYGFGYLEVGNEAYFQAWKNYAHPTPQDAAAYGKFAATLAGLALKIDPTVSIGLGVGNPGEWDNLWNAKILDACKANGFTPGFLSDHFYVHDGVPAGEGMTDAELLNNTVSDPNSVMPIHGNSPRNWAGRAAAYRKLLEQRLGDDAAAVQLLVGEFNSDANASTRQTTALTNGLFLADAVGSIMQTEYNGMMVWNLRGGYNPVAGRAGESGWRTGGDLGLIGDGDWHGTGSGAPANGPYIAFPTYHAQQLVSLLGETGDSVIKSSSDTRTVSAYATLRADGHLEVLLINKSPMVADNATFTIDGFVPDSKAELWRYGQTEDNAQKMSLDGASSLTHSQTQLMVAMNGGAAGFTINLPAYSMSVLDLAPADPDQEVPLTITAGTPVEFQAGSPAVLALPAATIAGPKIAFSRAVLLVKNTGAVATDILTVAPSASLVIGPSGTMTYNGRDVGSFQGGQGSDPLVIKFLASASPAETQAVLKSITFQNTDPSVGTADRSLTISATTGSGQAWPETTQTIRVISSAPEFNNLTNYNYRKGSTGGQLQATATITDPSDAFAASTLTVQIPGGTANDKLTIIPNKIRSLGVQIGGGYLTYNRVRVATVTGLNTSSLKVMFNTQATGAVVNAVLQRISFSNTKLAVGLTDRVVQFQFTNGKKLSAPAVTRQIHVVSTAQAKLGSLDQFFATQPFFLG